MIWSVLGAGVTGLCVATELADRGVPVEIVVPENAPQPVSILAGGMLAPFCEGETAPQVVETRGVSAIEWWQRHTRQVIRRGSLVVAPPRDRSELDRFARSTRNHVTVIPDSLEPELEDRFAKGVYFADEAHLDPALALTDLRSGLEDNGVAFVPSASGRIIDCRGMNAPLPGLRPVRGEMIDLFAPDVTLTRPIRLLHPRFPCYLVPRGGGRYMIGATMVETGRTGPVTARAAMELLSAAYALHPAFAEAEILRTASGLRPAFADNVPAIRREGTVIHVNGMYRHGFLMAPVLARDLADILVKEPAHAD